jgi:hypothetical protein
MDQFAAGLVVSVKEGKFVPEVIGFYIQNCACPNDLLDVLPRALINEPPHVIGYLQEIVGVLPVYKHRHVDLFRAVGHLRREMQGQGDEAPSSKRVRLF